MRLLGATFGLSCELPFSRITHCSNKNFLTRGGKEKWVKILNFVEEDALQSAEAHSIGKYVTFPK